MYASLFAAMVPSALGRLLSFLIILCLGAMFIWFAYMLGKRKALILKYIIHAHIILALIVVATFIGMFLDPESSFHKDPFFYVIPLIFWTLVASFPVYFLTRPKIKELFH